MVAKAARLEAFDIRREALEAEYREALVDALQSAAAGTWGLFDHNQDRRTREKLAPVIANLEDLAQSIDGLRDKLGLAGFALHEEFLAARGPVASSALGEPRQARVWLDRLGVPPR